MLVLTLSPPQADHHAVLCWLLESTIICTCFCHSNKCNLLHHKGTATDTVCPHCSCTITISVWMLCSESDSLLLCFSLWAKTWWPLSETFHIVTFWLAEAPQLTGSQEPPLMMVDEVVFMSISFSFSLWMEDLLSVWHQGEIVMLFLCLFLSAVFLCNYLFYECVFGIIW